MSGGKEQTDTRSQSNSDYAGTTSSSQRPVAPDGWEEYFNAVNPGSTGLTSDQTTALAALRGNLGRGTALGADPTISLLAGTARGDAGYGNNNSLALFQQWFPDLYKQIAPVSADTVGASTVGAKTGADFMSLYRNPFEDQVVDAALGDLERKHNLDITAAGNRQQAAGAFGGSASALSDALIADDYRKTVGSTAANLRSQGFTTAANLGVADAQRFLQSDLANQGTALDAAKANQAARLAAATQNQNNETQRQEFDVKQADVAQDRRVQAAKDWASLLSSGLGIDNQMIMSLLTGGGVGLEQGLNWLTAGRPLFGQDNEGSTSGSSSESGYGTTTKTKTPGLLDVIGTLAKAYAGTQGGG